MSIDTNVSFFAETTSQASRLGDLRSTLDTLERQVTTQKKYDTYAGFGAESFSLQRMENQQPVIQSYLDNLGKVVNRMDTMNKALTQITTLANQIVTALSTASTDPAGAQSLQQQAQSALKFVEDLLNQQDPSSGQYLFAGSDAASPPFADNNALQTNFKNQATSWLAGGISNAQLFANTDGFTTGNLGLNANLPASGAVTAHVDQNMDIDYTIKADLPGIQNIVRSLAFLANTPLPNPSDVATSAQYQAVMTHIASTLTSGISGTDNAAQSLAGKFNLVKALQDMHNNDLSVLQSQSGSMENADTTTALAQMQILQTQLTASYQVTKIVSQLSLTNFMP